MRDPEALLNIYYPAIAVQVGLEDYSTDEVAVVVLHAGHRRFLVQQWVLRQRDGEVYIILDEVLWLESPPVWEIHTWPGKARTSLLPAGFESTGVVCWVTRGLG